MSHNGHMVIDIDCHVREYTDLDRTFRGNIDPAYRDAYDRLSKAVAAAQRRPGEQVLFMHERAVLGPTPRRRPLGVHDTFGVEPVFGLAVGVAGAKIDPACSWEPAIRLRDMEVAQIDVSVMFPSQADGFCVLRDLGFERALHRAYHRYMADYCAEGEGRLRWVMSSTMRDPRATAEDLSYWAERDENMVAISIPRACPDGRLLDNPALYPIFERAQELDIPVLVHGGTLRPPVTPGASDLDNSGFMIGSLYHGWGGMTAAGALIGGGVLDQFPRLRIGICESGAGWLPWMVEQMDSAYRPRDGMTPKLKRKPSEVVAEGRLFCTVEPGEAHLDYAVQQLGEDIFMFATDYPHPGTPWPDGVAEIVDRPGLSESAKVKLLGENARRFAPRLAS